MYLTTVPRASLHLEWLKAAAPPGYVIIEVACDCLRACCLSVRLCQYWAFRYAAAESWALDRPASSSPGNSLTRIYCARRGFPLAPVPHVPNITAVKTF